MAERARILLAEFTPGVPQPVTFATWSPTDKHADIVLSGGNLTATRSTVHASNAVCVRSNVSILSGKAYWETTYAYTGTADMVAGIANGSASLNFMPGVVAGPADNVGGPNKAGNCLYVSITRASVGAVASGATICHWFDVDAGFYRCRLNGGPWVDVITPTVRPAGFGPVWGLWRPIAGLMRPTGTTVSITANFGASAFVYAVPGGANPGAYSTHDSVPTPVYLGSAGFNTEATDSPANTHYMGRIAGDQDVEFTREGSCIVWGGQTQTRGGQVAIVNNDGAVGNWLAWEWRDAPFVLYSGYEGDARSAFTVWAQGVCDNIVAGNQRRLIITLADPLALLDRPIQPTLYPVDQANAQVAGQPLPIVLGRPLYCDGALLDTASTARDWQLHDGDDDVASVSATLDSIAQIYDRGDIFAGPADPYVADNPITLANGGAFTTWAGIPPLPTNWLQITAFGSAGDRFLDGGAGTLRCQSGGQMVTAIYHSASALTAGKRYTIAFTVTAVTKPGPLTFRLGGAVDVQVAITATGARSVTIDCIVAAQLQIVLGLNMLVGSMLDVTIDSLTVSSVQIIDWTYWQSDATRLGFHLANAPAGKIVANPVGPSLTDALGTRVIEYPRDVLIWIAARYWDIYGTIGAIDFDTLSATTSSAALLDTTAHYRLANFIRQPLSLLALLRQVMDSFCGFATTILDGTVVFGRVDEPSSVAVLTLDDSNVMGEVLPSVDTAKGLSQRVAGGRNHSPHTDADIVTSATADLRAELKADFTCIRQGASGLAIGADLPVSAAYTQAVSATASPTMIQEPTDIQAESNRRCTLWRPTRYFYDLQALLERGQADALIPGQTVRLVWPRIPGLASGINLLVVRVRSRFFSRRVDLRLWGLPFPDPTEPTV
jgi:hypothetical protein